MVRLLVILLFDQVVEKNGYVSKAHVWFLYIRRNRQRDIIRKVAVGMNLEVL